MRRLLLIVGALVALAVVVVAVVQPGLIPGLSPTATPAPAATLVPEVPVEDVLVAEARAVPVRTATVGAAVAGSVVEVRVALGAQVRAGDPLVLLDTSAVDAEVAGAQAALTGASARAEQALAASEQALQGVATATAAVTQATAGVGAATAARDLVPEDAEDARIRAADAEVEIARAALSGARSQLAAARAALNVARRAADAAAADVERARAVVTGLEVARARLTLTAPIDGTVAWLSVVRAEQVLPGVPLLRIADTSAWRFETTDLSQDGAVRVRVGNGARITFDALPSFEIAGRVTSIGGLGVDRQGDVVVPVTITPEGAMPAGIVWNMTVSVTIRPAD